MKEKMIKYKKPLTAAAILLVLLLLVGVLALVDRLSVRSSLELDEESAAEFIRSELAELPLEQAKGSLYVLESLDFTVKSLEYGEEKDIRVTLEYTTPNVAAMYAEHKNDIFERAYKYWTERRADGLQATAVHIVVYMGDSVTELVKEAPRTGGEITVTVYDMGDEGGALYLSDDTLNALMGGYIDVRADIAATKELTVNGETVSIEKNNSIRTGVANCFGLNNYDSDKPDASPPVKRALNSFAADFRKNFIEDGRWKYLLTGLGNTLAITGLSLLLGIVLGFICAVVRVVCDKTGRLRPLSAVVKTYVTIMRGTPVMVQLLIVFFVLLLPLGIDKFLAAVLCFGLNSGAYVSEIIRGGIMSIDNGQTEAGRSLGLGFAPTMVYIVMPQAFKAVLPSLCNEFISLLKETSVAFYIGVADLTQGGLKIRSITYSNFMPLIAVALIYLVLVLVLTKLVSILERRLRKSER